jgi:hypothetical protein
MVSVVLGRVSMPFPENVKVACVWFIGVMFASDERSWYIGCGESSIPEEEDDDEGVVSAAVVVVVVAVVALLVVVVASTVAVLAMLDTMTMIVAKMNRVVAVAIG